MHVNDVTHIYIIIYSTYMPAVFDQYAIIMEKQQFSRQTAGYGVMMGVVFNHVPGTLIET